MKTFINIFLSGWVVLSIVPLITTGVMYLTVQRQKDEIKVLKERVQKQSGLIKKMKPFYEIRKTKTETTPKAEAER
ncbi:MAG: hypothetical protein KJO69_08795 [Gammaproteobacteria bacterium]|nr:hypothetical protein [Gammaproteobacteria bacterium]